MVGVTGFEPATGFRLPPRPERGALPD